MCSVLEKLNNVKRIVEAFIHVIIIASGGLHDLITLPSSKKYKNVHLFCNGGSVTLTPNSSYNDIIIIKIFYISLKSNVFGKNMIFMCYSSLSVYI